MNAYKTLGLSDKASTAEVKKAYRQLAAKLHPDKNREVGAQAKFQLVKEAYEFLTTGVSSTGYFTRVEPKVKPSPPPRKPGPFEQYANGSFSSAHNAHEYDYKTTKAQKLYEISLPINAIFTNPGTIAIPKTIYCFRGSKIAPGVTEEVSLVDYKSGSIIRKAKVTYKIFDPNGFYTLVYSPSRGMYDLACTVKASPAQILSEQEIILPKVNQFLDNPRVKLSFDKNMLILNGWGLPKGQGSTAKSNIDVHIKIENKTLDAEDYYVLQSLKTAIEKSLRTVEERFEQKLFSKKSR